jgi:hypothetical protein
MALKVTEVEFFRVTCLCRPYIESSGIERALSVALRSMVGSGKEEAPDAKVEVVLTDSEDPGL